VAKALVLIMRQKNSDKPEVAFAKILCLWLWHFNCKRFAIIEYTPRGRTSTKVIQLNLETRNTGQVGKSVISFDELFLLAIPA